MSRHTRERRIERAHCLTAQGPNGAVSRRQRFNRLTTYLLRVTLTESLAPDTERFTILLTPQGADAGTLALRWGRKELSVPIRVR